MDKGFLSPELPNNTLPLWASCSRIDVGVARSSGLRAQVLGGLDHVLQRGQHLHSNMLTVSCWEFAFLSELHA